MYAVHLVLDQLAKAPKVCVVFFVLFCFGLFVFFVCLFVLGFGFIFIGYFIFYILYFNILIFIPLFRVSSGFLLHFLCVLSRFVSFTFFSYLCHLLLATQEKLEKAKQENAALPEREKSVFSSFHLHK
jgi:hypothetical protein